MNVLRPLRPVRRALAGLLAGAALFAGASAQAGECPREHVLKTPRAVEEKADIGVARPTIAVVDLNGWRNVGKLWLRMRRLTIAPDGLVPTHAHDDRPSIAFILRGELVEHASNCAVPVLHREGEAAAEFGPGHEHWWENRTGREVVVLSVDVIPAEYFDPGTEHLRDNPKHDM